MPLLVIIFLTMSLAFAPFVTAHEGVDNRFTAPREAIPFLYPDRYTESEVKEGGTVSGKAMSLEGGTLKDAVIYIRGISQGKVFTIPEEPFLNQKEGVFSPRVLVVPVGSNVEIRNSDPEAHNLHSYSTRNVSFNEGIPAGGKPLSRRFDFVEAVRIGCDIHKEMQAWIIVRDNPYYCITKEDGLFKIEDLPPGGYKLCIWHEDFTREELAALTTDIKIEPDTEFEVDFYLSHYK